jgi:preprotein translocase subunit SecE
MNTLLFVKIILRNFKKEVSEELMKVVWHPNNFDKFQYLLGENTDIFI